MERAASIVRVSNSKHYKLDTLPETQSSGIITRISRSSLAHSSVGALALYKGCIEPLMTSKKNPIIGLVCLIALGILLRTKGDNYLKKLLYEVSIISVVAWDILNPSFQWVNEILPSNKGQGALALGSQPLKNKNHHLKYKNWAVLSMNEPFELECQTLLTEPVTPKDWQTVSPQREHKILACRDFYRVPTKHLVEAVTWIHAKRLKGIDVLVHCKAGKGRSAAVVVCYLLFVDMLKGKLKSSNTSDIIRTIQKVKMIRSFIATGKQIQTAAHCFIQNVGIVRRIHIING